LAKLHLLAPVYFSATLALFNALFVYLALPEPKRHVHLETAPILKPHDPRILPLLAAGFVISLASVSMETTVAFYFQDRLGLGPEETARAVARRLRRGRGVCPRVLNPPLQVATQSPPRRRHTPFLPRVFDLRLRRQLPAFDPGARAPGPGPRARRSRHHRRALARGGGKRAGDGRRPKQLGPGPRPHARPHHRHRPLPVDLPPGALHRKRPATIARSGIAYQNAFVSALITSSARVYTLYI